MEEITLGEIHRLLLEVRADVKAQNGRVSRHDTEIALIKQQQTSLSDDAKTHGRNWGAGAGAAGGLLGGFIAGLVHGLWGGK